MATTILKCPNCNSTDIGVLNSEKKKEVKTLSCKLNAVCRDCQHTFKFNTSTEFGHNMGILY